MALVSAYNIDINQNFHGGHEVSESNQIFNTVSPNQVDGYVDALSSGKIPSVPSEVPKVLPGRTAAQYVRNSVLVFVIAFVLAVVIGNNVRNVIGTSAALIIIVIGMG